jgi:hypothetical protein
METLTKELTKEQRFAKVDALMKRLIADKRQTQKQMVEDFKTNPEIIKAFQELKKRNNERGTPVISVRL